MTILLVKGRPLGIERVKTLHEMCVLDVAYGLPLVNLANCVSKLRVVHGGGGGISQTGVDHLLTFPDSCFAGAYMV